MKSEECDMLKQVKSLLTGFIDGLNTAHPLIQYIILVCALDAAGNYWCGRKSVGCSSVVFKSFIGYYLPNEYREMTQTIFKDIRCSLVHNFTIGKGIVLTAGNPDLRLCDENGKAVPVINLEDFKDAVRKAIESLIEDAENGVEVPCFSVPDSGNEGFSYIFKGEKSKVQFITKSVFECIRQIEECVSNGNSLDQGLLKWAFDNRLKYRELKDKYDFVTEVCEENVTCRKLVDNLRQVFEKEKPIRAKEVLKKDDEKTDLGDIYNNVFSFSDALSASTALDCRVCDSSFVTK